MKVIDLLNKIANGEEVPKKIKVGNKIYNYETFNIGKGDNYFTAEWEETKGYRTNYDGTYYYLEIRDYNLNDEVEILEEEKKIPEKLKIEQDKPGKQYYIRNEYGTKCGLTQHSRMIAETLNEVIDYLDYLKNKGE